MSALMLYFERTIKGMETYFSNDKTIVILVCVLLLLWMAEKKQSSEVNNRFLVYSAGMSLMLLFPVTAVLAVIYQSAYYDYEWVWSMVPVAAVVGYGGALFYEKAEKEKHGKLIWWLALLVLLFFCGNQGCLKTATGDTAKSNALTREIVSVIKADADMAVPILWGPKDIMQDLRRETGEIRLAYGMDMWDPKAGAYDYESYSPELIRAYEWMNSVSTLAMESGGAEEAVLYEKYEIVEQLPEIFSSIMESGVNVIVLPDSTSEKLDAIILETIENKYINVQKEYVERYVVYLLK